MLFVKLRMMIPENAEMIGTLQAYRTGQDPGGDALGITRGAAALRGMSNSLLVTAAPQG